MIGLRGSVERRTAVLFLVSRMLLDCGAATAERFIERIADGDQCGAHDD